jgi:hypothetical protein
MQLSEPQILFIMHLVLFICIIVPYVSAWLECNVNSGSNAGVALLNPLDATYAASSVGNSFCISFTALVSGKGLVNATSSIQGYYLVILGGGGAADATCPANETLVAQAQDAITGASYTIQNTTTRFQCGRNGFDCTVIATLCCQITDACNMVQVPATPTPSKSGLPPSTSIAVGVTLGTIGLVAIAGGVYAFVLWRGKKSKTTTAAVEVKRAEIYSSSAAYEQATQQI